MTLISGFTYATSSVTQASLEYQDIIRLPASIHGIARPIAVTIEPIGDETCITDSRSPAIHLVNRRGVATFQTTRFAGLSSPLDACVEADGSLVFLDKSLGLESRRTIRRLNIHGEPESLDIEFPAAVWTPSHLIVCADGGFLTLDTDAGTLAKHDSVTGALIWQNNLTGDESDRLFLGRPCEGPDGTIYVPGGELHAVLVLDANGRLTGRFGKFGTGPGKMVFPVAVAVGPQGTVLVLDRMRHKILVHDRELELLMEYGSFGSAPGQFYHPNGMAVSADGRVFVAQGFEGRIQMYRLVLGGRP